MTKKKPNVLITGASSGIGEALARHYAITGAGTLFISAATVNGSKRLKPPVKDTTSRYMPKSWT